MFERKRDKTYSDQSHQILLKDSKDGINKLKQILVDLNINKVEERSCKYPSSLDMEAFKQLITALSTESKSILVDTTSDENFKVVGIDEEVETFLN